MIQTKEMLVLLPLREDQKKFLCDAAKEYQVTYSSYDKVTAEQAKRAEIIFGNLPFPLLEECENLKWIQLNSAGIDGYPQRLKKGTLLTNGTGAYNLPVAEHMFSMLLAIYKKLYFYWDNQKNEVWEDLGKVRTLNGATVLIVGLGNIGLTFARMAKAFGAHVIGVKRRTGICPDGVDEMYSMEYLISLAENADVVASFLPDSEYTRGIYDQEFFTHMKKDGVFLNGGRGSAVCDQALVEALNSGEISAAALDVLNQEPLPLGHDFWKCKNLFLTPHISGHFHLDIVIEELLRITAENLEHYRKGERLKNQIDW